MNADLRESLGHLADATTPTHPASNASAAWTGGRRLRRRDRLVTAALTLAVAASLGGLATTLATEGDEAAPAADRSDAPAVPAVIEPSAELTTSDTLALGQASVAYVLDDEQPIVVGAGDGRHRALDLAGWRPGSSLALSPDGNRLAWVQVEDASTSQQVAAVDLRTGRVDELDTPADADEAIGHLSWSPDSRRVAWVAQEAGGSAVRSVSLRRTVDGVRWLLAKRLTSVAVSDRGDLVVGIDGGGLAGLDRGAESPWRVATPAPTAAGATSPSGSFVALSSDVARTTYTLDVTAKDVVDHPFPADTFASARSRPLGWLDDRLQLLLVQPAPDEPAELVITTPEVGETSTWRRRVGSVDPALATSLSVAVDLLPGLDGTSSQRFTRDFTDTGGIGGSVVEPASWRLGAVVLLVVLTLVLLVLLLVVLAGRFVVRRRRLS